MFKGLFNNINIFSGHLGNKITSFNEFNSIVFGQSQRGQIGMPNFLVFHDAVAVGVQKQIDAIDNVGAPLVLGVVQARWCRRRLGSRGRWKRSTMARVDGKRQHLQHQEQHIDGAGHCMVGWFYSMFERGGI